MAPIKQSVYELRKRRKLSQTKLGDLAGLDQATISRIEKGEIPLVSENAISLQKALGVELPELLGLAPTSDKRSEEQFKRIPVLDRFEAAKLADDKTKLDHLRPNGYIPSFGEHTIMAFALRIQDDSMGPEFKPNETIIVDPAKLNEVTPGRLVVAKTKNNIAVFMKYMLVGTDDHGNTLFKLVPLNNAYPVLDSKGDGLVIIGPVVEHNRKIT